MRYLSVCSGIEAVSVAWEPLGWRPLAFAEIEPFPRAVLAHRFPGVPLHGDFTRLRDKPWIADADLLVGGTPCQAFSVAGLRGSLDDARGNLTLEFVRLADAIDDLRRATGRAPAWIVWENVPGVLSTKDNAFGAFLGGLVGHDAAIPVPGGGSWPRSGVVSGPRRCAAWRVLDARHFGLAQRRERVFVLARGGAGDWGPADALLPIAESLRWHPAPRRQAATRVAAITARGAGTCGADDNQAQAGQLVAFGGNNTAGPIDVATALNACHTASGRMDFETETFIATTLRARDMARGVDSDCTDALIAHTLTGNGFDASEGCATVAHVTQFWARQPFDLRLTNNGGKTPQGNCDLCFLKGAATILGIIRNRPDLAEWWVKAEAEARASAPNGAVFRQDRPSYSAMLKMAQAQGDLFFGLSDDSLPCGCHD